VSDVGWETVRWLIEMISKREVSDGGREMFNRSIERNSGPEVKMSDLGGKMINWLVEIAAQTQMSDCWREMINRLIKVESKMKVREIGREVVHILIEVV